MQCHYFKKIGSKICTICFPPFSFTLKHCVIYAFWLCFLTFFIYCVYLYATFSPFSYTYQDIMQNKESNDPFLPRYSKSVLDRDGQILSVFLNTTEQWHIHTTSPVPHKLKAAVITYEDKNFYSHVGIDMTAIIRTLKNNITKDMRAGASTLTMQVIKLLEQNKRTYTNKLQEAMHALALETLYSKDEILQMYLNNAPYGGNIVGYKSASLLYFDKNPDSLTWSEASLLAVLPNAPGLINIVKNKPLLEKKRNALLIRLHEKGYFDSQILALSLKEPLPKGMKSHHNVASHLAVRVTRENPNKTIITTTISKSIQQKFEKKVKEYHEIIKRQGIMNVAALLLNTKTSEVMAYIGSQDFLDVENYGQIDGVVAKRSPGSLLKPLLYALSIDEGLIAPQSKLIDVPLFFSNFNPKNASNKYYGFVSARQSLISSLNIPFVRLLQEYGASKFFYTLQDIIHFQDNNPLRYGLSLILGTKELSMEEIAKIYLGLANMGEFGNLYYTLPYTQDSKKRLISDGASFLTLDTMKHLERVGLENYHKDKKIISWKSGTSYGKKDAWAAGVSPHYTIIVWAGNFTGEGNPKLSGVETAGRLLFALLTELQHVDDEFIMPNTMKNVTIDTLTGYRITQDLEYFDIPTTTILLPSEGKPLRPSPFLKKVWLNKKQTQQIDSTDYDFEKAIPSVKLQLPINVLNYYKTQHVNIYKYINTQNTKNSTLQIIYPLHGIKIIQPKDLQIQQHVVIRIANLAKQKVHWYLDKEYLGGFYDTTKVLDLGIGQHHLVIIGEDGSRDAISFTIER